MRLLGSVFGPDSVKPLYEHYLKIEAGAHQVKPFLERYLAGDFIESGRIAKLVAELEEEADRIKDETRKHISTSIFAAVKRPDIISFLSVQDDIADHYNKVLAMLQMRLTQIPEKVGSPMIKLCSRSLEVVYMLGGILRAVSQGVKEFQLDELGVRLAREEHFAAEEEENFLCELFKAEQELGSVAVVILMHVSDELLSIAKKARNASEILKRLIA